MHLGNTFVFVKGVFVKGDCLIFAQGLESECAGAGEHGANRVRGLVGGLALNLGLGAGRAGHGGAGGAGLGLRTVGCGAARAGAGRALANLAGLGACADAGRAGGHGGLEHIFGHVGLRRALGLEHVAGHVGHRRAGRHSRLQDPLAGIRIRAPASASPAHGSFLRLQGFGRGRRFKSLLGEHSPANKHSEHKHKDCAYQEQSC